MSQYNNCIICEVPRTRLFMCEACWRSYKRTKVMDIRWAANRVRKLERERFAKKVTWITIIARFVIKLLGSAVTSGVKHVSAHVSKLVYLTLIMIMPQNGEQNELLKPNKKEKIMNRYNDSEYQDEFTCPDCGATELSEISDFSSGFRWNSLGFKRSNVTLTREQSSND